MKASKAVSSFQKSLAVLQKADYQKSSNDEIYRSGIVAEFARTFELAWKSVQAVLESEGVNTLMRGSPRSVISAAYAADLLSDADLWLHMLEVRSDAFHRYDRDIAGTLMENIQTHYVPAFEDLAAQLAILLENDTDH